MHGVRLLCMVARRVAQLWWHEVCSPPVVGGEEAPSHPCAATHRSSSLHGLIFAEAFGVPARWLHPPKQPGLRSGSSQTQGWFKYVDYYTATRPALAAMYHTVPLRTLVGRVNYTRGRRSWAFRPEPPAALAPFGLQPAASLEEAIRMGGAPGMSYDPNALLEAFPTELAAACPRSGKAPQSRVSRVVGLAQPCR